MSPILTFGEYSRNGAVSFEPAYLQLYRTGELQRRANQALAQLRDCNLCAQYCHVDRLQPDSGSACHTGRQAKICSSVDITPVEEPLGGKTHNGIIRFAGCGLSCPYCEHWETEQTSSALTVDAEELADIMLSSQARGNPNLYLHGAGHVIAQILESLVIACDRGLTLPLVYNSNGYDSLESLQLLDGVIDIYAPEIKYGSNSCAEKYSRASNYVEYSHIALREMYRQVGDLIIDEDGIARRGLVVRHLILPANQASTKKVLSFLSSDISPDTYVNLMDDYQPRHLSYKFMKLNRPVNEDEVRQALRCGTRCGLHRMDLHMTQPWNVL